MSIYCVGSLKGEFAMALNNIVRNIEGKGQVSLPVLGSFGGMFVTSDGRNRILIVDTGFVNAIEIPLPEKSLTFVKLGKIFSYMDIIGIPEKGRVALAQYKNILKVVLSFNLGGGLRFGSRLDSNCAVAIPSDNIGNVVIFERNATVLVVEGQTLQRCSLQIKEKE